ncbi:MAG TPA: hypothetical protein VGY54_03270 [Polyangiaceae bacterium]|jgi:hypothetical protein|nr:hypothetical protein [Polyangiaceae bacterium]
MTPQHGVDRSAKNPTRHPVDVLEARGEARAIGLGGDDDMRSEVENMSKGDITALTDSVRALVLRAVAVEAAPEGAKARVLARVDAIVGRPSAAGGDGHSSSVHRVAKPRRPRRNRSSALRVRRR